MRSIWFWLLLFFLWLILGYFIANAFICPLAAVGGGNCSQWEVEDKNFEVESDNYIHFRRSSAAHTTNYQDVNNTINKVAQYLKSKPQRALTITGIYDSLEQNSNPLSANLGYARAKDVKNWLVSKGAAPQQIALNSRVEEYNCFRNDTLRRGADFSFGTLATDNKRLAAIKQNLFGKPIRLYFNTGSDTPNITSAQLTQFQDLFYYLDNVPGAKLDIGGHTDNAGQLNANITLSQNRANDIRNFLVQNGGVALSRMDTDGFGPNSPLAANDTPANMALNRRVEVTLK